MEIFIHSICTNIGKVEDIFADVSGEKEKEFNWIVYLESRRKNKTQSA